MRCLTWPERMDLLSSSYGWTTEHILSKTLWEINWRLNETIKRLNLDRRFEMSIHGIDPTAALEDNDEPAMDKLDDNQKEALSIALLKAKERKRLQFENKV